MFKMWFWVTTRTGFHVLMLKKSISFLILSSAVPLCMKYSVLAHVSLRLLPSVLWLVSAHMPEPEQLTAFQIGSIVYRLPDSFTSTVNIFVNYAKVRYGNAVWRHKVTGQDHVTTTDEPFQEQCFLWQRGALIDVDFDLFNYKKFYVHKNWYNTRKERKKQTKKKSIEQKVSFKTENMLFKRCWHIALPAGWHLSGCGCTSLGISIIWPLPPLLLSQYAVIIITKDIKLNSFL